MSVSTPVAVNAKNKGMNVSRVYTKPDVHPYDEVVWETTDIVLRNLRDDSINFEQSGVEFPASWSANARQIVASKYFRGQLGTDARESSLKHTIDRVVGKYTDEGFSRGYFATRDDSEIFRAELTYMLLHQIFSFNSPVWFNVGTKTSQQVSACFILRVDDDMESILNWYREEGMIFKGGSGAGVNLSRIRGSQEFLSGGGRASGPVSFMRGADSSAGSIASGGTTRRAAKMVCLDIDHPDIEQFIGIKAREERKIRALRAAGFDMDINGIDASSVQYQNANNSVRVTDEFMQAVVDGRPFSLHNRVDGEVSKTLPARELFEQIAQAAWECACPGIQYDTTINSWHTCPDSGRITSSNPCSEYMHLDNSSCNLASLNLTKFMTPDSGFDARRFIQSVELIILAMDISIDFADFPTEKITEVSRTFRQLGLGYSNLGALLMSMGLAYDSDDGRALARDITSLMSAAAYRRSAELASRFGAYDGFAQNSSSHHAVVRRHALANSSYVGGSPRSSLALVAQEEWDRALEVGFKSGYRNAQLTLLAPAGTISFMMDCDTTGVEPDFMLKKFKKLHGGGSMEIVNLSVPTALRGMGYSSGQIEQIVRFIADNNTVVGAPDLLESHYSVFDCAVGSRFISPMGHVRMMASVQPFLSGAISKTVNLPSHSTVDDIASIYMEGWRLGLKALAVYRDNSKATQALATAEQEEPAQPTVPVRRRLPARREGLTTSFTVGGADGYLTSSSAENGQLGEIFLKLGKQGSTLAGVMDAFAIAVSIGLQYGIPLETYAEKFTGLQFEPRGMTSDPDIRIATSVLDYVFRRLSLDYLSREQREALGLLSVEERVAALGVVAELVSSSPDTAGFSLSAPLCNRCGVAMSRAGVCWSCPSCGDTSGCS